MKNEEIKRMAAESMQLLQENKADDAVRLSGEMLANADAVWRQAYNAKADSTECITDFAGAAVVHCLALFSAGQYGECFGTTVVCDLQITIDGIAQDSIAAPLLKLRNLGLTALLNMLGETPVSDDEEVREHVAHILRYMFNLTYYTYNKVIANGSDSLDEETKVAAVRAHDTLRYMLDNGFMVELPEVTVCGRMVSPEKPADIIGDIIGRARALGLIHLGE